METRFSLLFALVLSGSLLATHAGAGDVKRISKEDLKGMLGDANVVIIDVRTGSDWDNSNQKIEGAVREFPESFDSWAEKYSKDSTLVLYCS